MHGCIARISKSVRSRVHVCECTCKRGTRALIAHVKGCTNTLDMCKQRQVSELIRPRPKQTPLHLPLLDEKGKGNIGSITVISAVTFGPINRPLSLLTGESLSRFVMFICQDHVRMHTLKPARAHITLRDARASMHVRMPSREHAQAHTHTHAHAHTRAHTHTQVGLPR